MSEAEDTLVALKERCVEDETQEEHDTHAEELAAAYARFQAESGTEAETTSNPAEGEVALTAEVVAQADADASGG